MSDLYLEELVKRKRTGTDQALRYALMAVTAIGVVLSLLTWNLIIIAVSIAICVADIFIFPRFQTEWEYQYVNGELEGMLKVLFEPSEHMVKDFRLKAPRKVFFD